MRKLGLEMWAVRVVQSMYIGDTNRVRIKSQLSNVFGVNVGVHQVLSPLLLILVLEALSRESRTCVPWDDLVLISESLDDCIFKFKKRKLEMESKRLWVNSKKTILMLLGSENLRDSEDFPCNKCIKNSSYLMFFVTKPSPILKRDGGSNSSSSIAIALQTVSGSEVAFQTRRGLAPLSTIATYMIRFGIDG